jgi:hypothetical protein
VPLSRDFRPMALKLDRTIVRALYDADRGGDGPAFECELRGERQRLGLKLESGNVPADVLVIASADKPSETEKH